MAKHNLSIIIAIIFATIFLSACISFEGSSYVRRPELTETPEPLPKCDPSTQPFPHWSEKNGECLPSCGVLKGNKCLTSSSCPSGYHSVGNSYDCNSCCVENTTPQQSPIPQPGPEPPPTPNPCSGVTCDLPPANYCGGNNLITYSQFGACSNGECNYETNLQTCPNGCSSGQCVNTQPPSGSDLPENGKSVIIKVDNFQDFNEVPTWLEHSNELWEFHLSDEYLKGDCAIKAIEENGQWPDKSYIYYIHKGTVLDYFPIGNFPFYRMGICDINADCPDKESGSVALSATYMFKNFERSECGDCSLAVNNTYYWLRGDLLCGNDGIWYFCSESFNHGKNKAFTIGDKRYICTKNNEWRNA